jgi:hypothetical protein
MPLKEKAARRGGFSSPSISESNLFRSSLGQSRCLAGSAFFASGFAFSGTARTAGTGACGAATWLAFNRLRCATFCFHGNFRRNAFDFRLRSGSVDSLRLLERCGRLLFAWLARFARLARFTLFALLLTLFALRLSLFTLLLMRRLNDDDIVIVIVTRIHIVAIAIRTVTIVIILAVVALETFLHLRLRGGNDAVVMFGVLQIVFSYDAVAGALGITGELRIFFGDVLGSAADLHIGAGTVVGPGQRVPTLAVEIVVIVISTAAIVIIVVVITTPSTALVLLSWPHRSFT